MTTTVSRAEATNLKRYLIVESYDEEEEEEEEERFNPFIFGRRFLFMK